jgi:hypothetical protein
LPEPARTGAGPLWPLTQETATMNTPSPQQPRKRTPDEPEITQEESVPTDGRDVEGEEQMKKVGNDKLREPGDAERKTPEKS